MIVTVLVTIIIGLSLYFCLRTKTQPKAKLTQGETYVTTLPMPNSPKKESNDFKAMTEYKPDSKFTLKMDGDMVPSAHYMTVSRNVNRNTQITVDSEKDDTRQK